ncbi:MAG: cysteine synthase A [Acidobacteriota bacterium]
MIGMTPIVRLNSMVPVGWAEVLIKLESFNPGGSVKDRIGFNMVLDAVMKGRLKSGGTIIEPTSGNTGIGLALMAAAKGYHMILVMPENFSMERRQLLKAYGAELYLTPAHEGMAGAISKAEELCRQHPDWYMPQQFKNPANPQVHLETTGPEIMADTGDKLDYFVAGVGTGGTLSGVGKYLKDNIPGVKVIAVEPRDSALLSGGQPGPHKIQGIGANFIPEILDRNLIDEVITVSNQDAYETARRLAREEGMLCGISSGAAVFAALQIAQRAGSGTRILAIAPDTGERYLSAGLFDVD